MQEELEARLNRLERENQRMKRGALLLIVLAFGVACVGQTQGPRVSDEVRTRRLIVEDGSGNTVAELKDIQGGGWLALYDGTEKPRVQLSAILDSQGLTVGLKDDPFHSRRTTSILGPVELRKKIVYEGKLDENVDNLVNSLIKEGVLRG